MKNFYASNSAHAIPYRPELKVCFVPFEPVKGNAPREMTTSGAILLQQLDYWFARYPNGFYKFMEPPKTEQRAYRPGDSWTEELYFSRKEFTTAFDQIGIAYKSKGQFDKASKRGDVFQGRFYCSYYDRIGRVTWYYRNHQAVDAFLDEVSKTALKGKATSNGQKEIPNSQSGKSGNDETAFLGNDQSANLEMTDRQFEYTETNSRDYQTENTATTPQAGSGGSDVSLVSESKSIDEDKSSAMAKELVSFLASQGIKVRASKPLVEACKGKSGAQAFLCGMAVIEKSKQMAIKTPQGMVTTALREWWAPTWDFIVVGKWNETTKQIWIQEQINAMTSLDKFELLDVVHCDLKKTSFILYTKDGNELRYEYTLPLMSQNSEYSLSYLWSELHCAMEVA